MTVIFHVTQRVHQNLYNHGQASGSFLKPGSTNTPMMGILAFLLAKWVCDSYERIERPDFQQELAARHRVVGLVRKTMADGWF